MLVHKHLGHLGTAGGGVSVGVNPSVCVSWCSDMTSGDVGVIAHGLSHKFGCIYLFLLVVVLGCVRLPRGAHGMRP